MRTLTTHFWWPSIQPAAGRRPATQTVASSVSPWLRASVLPCSYFFREAVAQPIKHKVADQEHAYRQHADERQRLLMPERAVEKQHLLIRAHDVRHRIQVEQPRDVRRRQ